MRYLKTQVLINGQKTTVLGKGSDRITMGQMINRIRDEIKNQYDDPDVEVLDHELIDAEIYEQESMNKFTYVVTRRTDVPFGNCHYGSRYRETTNARAGGPVSFTELEET